MDKFQQERTRKAFGSRPRTSVFLLTAYYQSMGCILSGFSLRKEYYGLRCWLQTSAAITARAWVNIFDLSANYGQNLTVEFLSFSVLNKNSPRPKPCRRRCARIESGGRHWWRPGEPRRKGRVGQGYKGYLADDREGSSKEERSASFNPYLSTRAKAWAKAPTSSGWWASELTTTVKPS